MRRGLGPALLTIALLLITGPGVLRAASAPERMLEEQLRGRGIRDARVLAAFRRVPREAFAPLELRDRAYDDQPLPIGHGQTMSQPYVVALMTELLGLKGGEKVLEIGTGSGYQAAILGELAHEVYSVEIVPELATAARLRLTREGYRNVHVKQGDGTLGWRDYGLYDAIMVTAVAPSVPGALIDQLVEGGVLVMPLGEPNGRQVLVRGVKRGGKLRTHEITEVNFVPMTGEAARRRSGPPAAAPAPPRSPSGGAPRPSGGREIIEEELPDRGGRDGESDTRRHRGARSRAARAPSARGTDRRYAADAAARAGDDSPAVGRRCAG